MNCRRNSLFLSPAFANINHERLIYRGEQCCMKKEEEVINVDCLLEIRDKDDDACIKRDNNFLLLDSIKWCKQAEKSDDIKDTHSHKWTLDSRLEKKKKRLASTCTACKRRTQNTSAAQISSFDTTNTFTVNLYLTNYWNK